ncbi:hypothetical protein CDEST_13249 [Colletotrichum destructivum]|uniref:Uncharacterized protein n=1 Tax=Colletotrichum destructivum TaxID=34406 RepID=A0AAX4IYD2_9PEZI|nr:hypothetical protein CDEST_13249 [Colletotrichum destructivum]
MVLLEMTTYLTLLILTFFRFLLDGGYYLLIRDLGFIIVNLLAWFPNMVAGMLIRYYVIPVFSWLGFGPRGSIVGELFPTSRSRVLCLFSFAKNSFGERVE